MTMNKKTRALMIEIAGFLKLLADGHVLVPDHAKREAALLLDKIGETYR